MFPSSFLVLSSCPCSTEVDSKRNNILKVLRSFSEDKSCDIASSWGISQIISKITPLLVLLTGPAIPSSSEHPIRLTIRPGSVTVHAVHRLVHTL